MAHFARLNDENVVVAVHVVNNDVLDATNEEASGSQFLEGLYGVTGWKQTSYNATFRKHYASVGYTYREDLDAFISPKCHDEAQLDEDTCTWVCANENHNITLEG